MTDTEKRVTCNCLVCDRQFDVPEQVFESFYGEPMCSPDCEEEWEQMWSELGLGIKEGG